MKCWLNMDSSYHNGKFYAMMAYMKKFLLVILILLPQVLFAQNLIDPKIDFKNKLENKGVNYSINYLPIGGYTYSGKPYKVEPTSIWWHWDAGVNIYNVWGALERVSVTYKILNNRIAHNDPASTHFTVGPNTILQMLPIYENSIIQARLTNDQGVEDVTKAESYGVIQIETTGRYYDTNPPLESQTNTLIMLTRELMRKYNIPFSQIYGHFEKSPRIHKIDPGPKYMNETRIKLLKYLIKNKDWDLIGDPKSWNFYTEKLDASGKVVKVLSQSKDEIMEALFR